jgi:hypothetical protein
MTEKECAKQRRRYRSRAEADQLAAEFESSGLTQREFCERRGVALKSLARYLRRYRGQSVAAAAEPHWVSVEVAGAEAAGSGLRVALPGGRRIEVERGFDAATLGRLVLSLEEL